MLSFLYCFIVKGKFISAKSFPPVGIEPATLKPSYLQSHAYPTVLIPQVSIGGYLTLLVWVK